MVCCKLSEHGFCQVKLCLSRTASAGKGENMFSYLLAFSAESIPPALGEVQDAVLVRSCAAPCNSCSAEVGLQ